MASASSVLATACDGDNLSAIVHSMMSGNVPAAQFLISKGALVDTIDGMGMVPLHHAVFSGDPEAVSMLLEAGANTAIADGDGKVPSEYAQGPIAALLAEAPPAAGEAGRLDKDKMAALAAEFGISSAQLDAVKDAACSGDIPKLEMLLAGDE